MVVGDFFMKKYLGVFIACAVVLPAFGAGRSMLGAGQNASRVVLPTTQFKSSLKRGGLAGESAPVATTNTVDDSGASRSATDNDEDVKPVPVNRDKERLACLSNNIGIGNTFVWASKNSNTSNYANMVEDVDHPENNVCFVLVSMRSEDSRVSVADIQPRYFEWGKNITCGSWVDEAKMESRILDAKKNTRTLGTIGGAVGGGAIGVGAMELFGNRLLSSAGVGSVQGQKNENLTDVELTNSQAMHLKEKEPNVYRTFEDLVKKLHDKCKGSNSDDKCKDEKYKKLVDWYDAYHKSN